MKKITFGYCICFVLFSLFLFSCRRPITPPGPEDAESSWDLIHTFILEPNCVACHTPGNSFATESNLDLTRGAAYSQLVGREPHNQDAKDDGLMLLGTSGISSLYSSFFWEKINAPNSDHFYADHPEYGAIMPLGGKPLTNGELTYIRTWIEGGAPSTGFTASHELLLDESRFEDENYVFAPLDTPSSGYQISLGPFEIFPQGEREFFYYWPLNNPTYQYVNRFELNMRKGSHHFLFYKFLANAPKPMSNEYRDLRDENGNGIIETFQSIEGQIFVWGSQLNSVDYQLPPGVALEIDANQGLDINCHYVNFTDEPTQGEISANIHTIPYSEVDHVAHNLFLSNEIIHLPKNSEKTLTKSFVFDENREIFMLWSHAHQRMTQFKIFIKGGSRDGELVYFTNDWEHPPMMEFDPPISLNSGEGLKMEVTYFNESNHPVTFGLLSEDEMMIIFGMYY